MNIQTGLITAFTTLCLLFSLSLTHKFLPGREQWVAGGSRRLGTQRGHRSQIGRMSCREEGSAKESWLAASWTQLQWIKTLQRNSIVFNISFKMRGRLAEPGWDHLIVDAKLIVLRGRLKPFIFEYFVFWDCFLLSFAVFCFLSCCHFFLRDYYSLQVYYLFNFLSDTVLLLKYVLFLCQHTFLNLRSFLPATAIHQLGLVVTHYLVGALPWPLGVGGGVTDRRHGS